MCKAWRLRVVAHFHDRLVRKLEAVTARDKLLFDLDRRAARAAFRDVACPKTRRTN